MRGGIGSVDAVDKNYARLAVAVSHLDDFVEDPSRRQAANLLPRPRVYEGVRLLALQCRHEIVRQRDGDVEIIEAALVGLARYKLHDVGMVDAKNAHISPAASPALFDGFGRRVEDLHKRNGPARDAFGGHHDVVLGPDAGEGKSGAAAALVYERRVLHGVEDALHRVLHREDEAGR